MYECARCATSFTREELDSGKWIGIREADDDAPVILVCGSCQTTEEHDAAPMIAAYIGQGGVRLTEETYPLIVSSGGE